MKQGKMVETFLIHSLLELRYREARVTKADAIIEDRAAQFLKAPAESRFLVAPQRRRRSHWWRARIAPLDHGDGQCGGSGHIARRDRRAAAAGSLFPDEHGDAPIELAPLGIIRAVGLAVWRHGIARAETGCCEACRSQLLMAHEPCLDGGGASLRQAMIVGVFSKRIRVAADSDGPVRLGSDDVGQSYAAWTPPPRAGRTCRNRRERPPPA